MGKTTYRLVPFETYEVENLESWLSSLSGCGLYPVRVYSSPLLVKCEKGEPGACQVRLEPAGRNEDEVPDALCELYEAAGWEYIGTFGRLFHTFRTLESTAPEPHSDPDLYAQVIRRSTRRAIREFILSNAILLGALAFILAMTLSDEQPLLALLNNGLWKMLYLAVLVVLGLSAELRQLCSVISFRQRLKKGKPPRRNLHFSAWRLTLHRAVTCLLLLLSFAWYILLFASIGFTDSHTVAQDEALPFPQLAALSPQAQPGGFRANGTDYANHVAVTRDLIVPLVYELRQSDMDADIELQVDCYLCAVPQINQQLARELAPSTAPESELLWSDGVFYVRYYTVPAPYNPGTMQCLIVCTAERAAFVRYQGEADLREYAPAFAGLEEKENL
jgi:hypothetical protein